MRYALIESFEGDWARLSETERRRFRTVVPAFNSACDRIASDPAARFSGSLRVTAVERAPGILEMTWSFSGPDGRATFEWVTIDGERGVRWRRIGGHAIFREP